MFKQHGSPARFARKIVGIALIGTLAIALLGYLVMALWNGLLPPLFGFRTIHFWQALGLLVLSRILFGGFHGGGSRKYHRRRMLERWERMTPEERERFKAGMRGGWCREEGQGIPREG